MSRFPEFSLIYYPGSRAIAYLNILRELGARPQVIITLNNNRDLTQNDNFVRELSAQQAPFDIRYRLEDYLAEYPTPVFHSLATSINDPTVSQLLHSQGPCTWLFTGGGILRSHLFQCDARYLHVHPGELPSFRGSTCFYYSLLHNNSLTATAFFLKQQLDSGDTVCKKSFRVNLPNTEQAALLMDHIVDPWMRAQTLKTAFARRFEISPAQTPDETTPRPYYVMHPVLRSITAHKQQGRADLQLPFGIFPQE